MSFSSLEQIQIKTKIIKVGHEDWAIEYEEGTVQCIVNMV